MNIVGRVALGGLVLIGVFSCQPKSPLSDITGTLSVLIPKPQIQPQKSGQQVDQNNYILEPVQLNEIKVLKEMRGNYAEFFYSPGAKEGSLFGNAPRARYSKSEQGFYIPLDVISSQMATIYYHLQNLIQLNESIDLQSITRKPFQVGLEVRKADQEKSYEKNNAFYDGYSDSMLFLPMSNTELSLSLNAGVIAHEFFHSIFYKKVLGKIKISKQDSEKKDIAGADLFNLTYVRGLNEGLADFWGWLYTKDQNFMRYSFAGSNEGRSLNLNADEIGEFENQSEIRDEVEIAVASKTQTDNLLLSYIYKIGTPHARFMRKLVDLDAPELADQKSMYRIESDEKKWIQITIDFLDQVAEEINVLENKEVSAGRLFEYIAERSMKDNILNSEQCNLVLPYLLADREFVDETSQADAIKCVKKEKSVFYEIQK
jgi:hypothetical protein